MSDESDFAIPVETEAVVDRAVGAFDCKRMSWRVRL